MFLENYFDFDHDIIICLLFLKKKYKLPKEKL